MTSESFTLTETDLALVEALQVAPRAPWVSLAAAVGVNPTTATSHWARILDSGAAWVTGVPDLAVQTTQCVAYVEVSCVPARRLAISELLAKDQHSLSVELTAGGADLFLTVGAGDLTSLSRYLHGRLDRIPGIIGTRARVATKLYRDGSAWRVGALPPEGANALRERADGASVDPAPDELSSEDRSILVQLGFNGRASYAELSKAAGVSEATARRRLSRFMRCGVVRLRADVSGPLTGWPVLVNLSADVPTTRLESAATALSRLRHVRLCGTMVGSPPLVVSAWLRKVEDLHRFEAVLTRMVPELTVVDRLLTLRQVKRMGRLLDADGRAIGTVPMDVWSDPLAGIPQSA